MENRAAVEAPEDRVRSVLDPIHGLIRLTEVELSVVDHPLFQRLRHIKQNGLLHLIFPAATHTRFEHSLGALYVAHGILNSLRLNAAVGEAKGSVVPFETAQIRQATTFPRYGSRERDLLFSVTRLAALTHDLGHGPLSHTFDSFAPERSRLHRLLDEPDLSALLPLREFLLSWGTDDRKNPSSSKNLRVPHEVMSCVFFAKIWHDLQKDEDTARNVCAAILGAHGDSSAAMSLSDPIARRWIPLVHDIIASAPADADRMDYMERDSRSIGVTYGLFDRNRVLKSLLPYKSEEHGATVYRLGVKQSGLKAIENLLQARYELFVQVYYHKTNRAVSRMLEAIALTANEQMDLFTGLDSLPAVTGRYLELTDEQFLRILQGKTEFSPPAEIADLADRIEQRQLWKRILDPTTRSEADRVLEALRNEFPTLATCINLDDTKPRALKDLEKGAALLRRRGGGAYEAGDEGPWIGASSIIRALEEADDLFVRIYFDCNDVEAAQRVRERALALAFTGGEDPDAQA